MSDRTKFPLSPMVVSYLSGLSRTEIAHVAEIAIDRLDMLDGDPDMEPNGDDEPLSANGDGDDGAWIEWHQMRASQKRGPNILPSYNEDDEDDDPAGQSDEDGQNTMFDVCRDNGAGCPIADPGGCQHDGREHEDAY